jgi:hypothetical protein
VNKPPTSSFLVLGTNYKSYGFTVTEASTGANSINARKIGKFVVEFKDGHKLNFMFPHISIKGLMVGKRTFNYKHSGVVIDEANNLCWFVKFNPDEKSALGKLFFSQKSNVDFAK